MNLFALSDTVFRRYDTFARSNNPTEFVASLSLNYRDREPIIEASYRRLQDENLYMQLSSGVVAETTEGEIAATIKWSGADSTVRECPGIADAWERARHIELNDLSEIPQFNVSASSEEEEIVLRLHARMYEVAFRVDDQVITVVQDGGPSALADWVEESILVLEACGRKN